MHRRGESLRCSEGGLLSATATNMNFLYWLCTHPAGFNPLGYWLLCPQMDGFLIALWGSFHSTRCLYFLHVAVASYIYKTQMKCALCPSSLCFSLVPFSLRCILLVAPDGVWGVMLELESAISSDKHLHIATLKTRASTYTKHTPFSVHHYLSHQHRRVRWAEMRN